MCMGMGMGMMMACYSYSGGSECNECRMDGLFALCLPLTPIRWMPDLPFDFNATIWRTISGAVMDRNDSGDFIKQILEQTAN